MSKPKAVHSRPPQKDRAVWFNKHASFPMRDTSPVELEKFWGAQIAADVDPAHQWECVGPFNVAGRVTSLAIHPHHPERWYAGSATGGLWVSGNAGESWDARWNAYGNQNIGAIAFSVLDNRAILTVGTGEANMSADAYPGSGVFQSLDDGLTWQPLFRRLDPSQGSQASSESAEFDVRTFPRRIGCIALRRRRMAFASVFLDDSLPGGLYLCNARASTGFVPVEFWGQRSYNCHSVLFHPEDDSTLFASIEPDGSLNGIWRTRNFGKTWHHLTKGLPSGDQFRRTSLAFAPSDPDVIYALAADRASRILGVFRSTNGGDSWREILGGRFPKERQMTYNNTIAVHPRKPDSVVWGGMHLYRTDNAGRNWRGISSTDRSRSDYVHGDHHALLWPEDDLIISGNDGGVSVSHNGGRTWNERSRGMVSTMFYGIDVAPSNGKVFGGGTQDNGTLIAGVDGAAKGDFVQAIPGDGSWMAFDHADYRNFFGCATGFAIYRHQRTRPWNFAEANWRRIQPGDISDQERTQREFTVLAIEPSSRHGVKTLWAGSNRLWRTVNDGARWKPVSGSFDGSPISAIEISQVRARLLFVGTNNGGIFRSQDGGDTWSQSLSAVDIPARAITSIACHPKFAGIVVVTVAASGVNNSGVQLSTGKDLPYSHAFFSGDGGDTWEDLERGQLPNVVFYSAVFEKHRPYRLFLAGDAGVWASSTERGWFNISGNLPSVVVSGLVYHKRDRTLTAATYGRGLWRINARRAFKPFMPKEPLPEKTPVAFGMRVDPTAPVPLQWAPPEGAVVAQTTRFSTTTVTVQPVPGAIGYLVEFLPTDSFSVGFSSFTTEIPITSPDSRGGKWRACAILPNGLRSDLSPWRSLSFSVARRKRLGQ